LGTSAVNKKIEIISRAALAKKANDILVVDLRKFATICDYFVIAGGDSTIHIDAIAQAIEKDLSKGGFRVYHREGRKEALWILLDCGNVVTHIFYNKTRGFYNLEKIWHDAPRKRISENTFRQKKV